MPDPDARRLRTRVQEALAEFAAELDQRVVLLLRLDAFGDDLHAECARQREDGAHDRRAAAAVAGRNPSRSSARLLGLIPMAPVSRGDRVMRWF